MRRAYLGWIVFVGTIAIGIALVCFTKRVQAQVLADYAPFIGTYTGETMVETSSGPAKRALDVALSREAEGFSLEWTTDGNAR